MNQLPVRNISMALALSVLAFMPQARALELLSGVSQIAVGSQHSCALSGQGGVVCWGNGSRGQLGTGSSNDSVTPVAVLGLSDGVAAISATHFHTCALLDTGVVKCWGMNYSGQIGGGGLEDAFAPTDVVGLGGPAQAVFAGSGHSCAILVDGAVKCWGANTYGQLGNGGIASSPIPVPVVGLGGDAQSLSLNGWHSCALMTDGAVKCWGGDTHGQLGRRDWTTPTSVPAEVLGLSASVMEVSSGYTHVCVLTATGTVECWGSNLRGQLAMSPDTSSIRDPVVVSGLGSAAVSIGMAWYGGCARLLNGDVKCWGSNQFGALGNGDIVDSPTPVLVTSLRTPVTQLDAGSSHACALQASGGVDCWGWNNVGQLGNGRSSVSIKPSPVAGLDATVTEASIRHLHGCAVSASGMVECWGNNSAGQLGDGSQMDSPSPVTVQGLDSGTQTVATGRTHSCAVSDMGGAACWGDNGFGQLGDGTSSDSLSAVNVQGLETGVAALSVAGWHSCALTQAGAVSCWGMDWLETYNPLPGMPTPVIHYSPQPVVGLETGVEEITTGWLHGCARLPSGTVRCWGSNDAGQLGNGNVVDSAAPVDVVGLGAVSSIRAGDSHTCALTVAGSVYCWGFNQSGETGSGPIGGSVLLPMRVTGLDDRVVAIASGARHSCALTDVGEMFCWGSNEGGQLGRGAMARSAVPQRVLGLQGEVTKILAGEAHSCAFLAGQGLHCWGRNNLGQLGTQGVGYETFAQPVIAVDALRVFADDFEP